jgi:hypothetical protein
LRDSELIFADFIASRVRAFSDDMYRVSPFLFASVLKKYSPWNAFSAHQIEKFFKSQTVRTRDALHRAIKWGDADTYRLFARYAMDWVLPQVSRCFLSRVISRRRSAIEEFATAARAEDCNRWFLMDWLNRLREAAGDHPGDEVELLGAMGTLGGSVNPIPICRLGFITPDCSPSLSVSCEMLFEVTETKDYYISDVTVVEPHVGLTLNSFAFQLLRAVFRHRGKGRPPAELNVFLFFERVVVAQLDGVPLNDGELVLVTRDRPVITGIRFTMSPFQSAIGGPLAVLRATEIRVYGTLIPAIARC